ncbi:hypothetical protein WJ73_02890 [Burkholderia ubonensis]|nr:hypothetical protein WJ73_02900 [Burkholderia ubonensis]KVO19825.1 hypothetical protein WJ73_02890 [Burkholderia ubonensis]
MKLNDVAADVLPATSICRTCTLFTPSTALKLVFQCAPLSTLYCTVAPVSMPVRFNVPTLVM